MAAGIAYNAFVSLAPMLILLYFFFSVAGGGLEDRTVEAAGQWLPGPIADVVQQLFQGSPSGGASLAGLVVLIWGTLKIFRGLDTAFSEIYETEANNTFVDKLTDGLVVLFALGVAIVVTVAAGAILTVFSELLPFVETLVPLALFLGLVLAFAPMYYVFPDADVAVWDVLPGVVFAAVGWAAFQELFQVYLAFKGGGMGEFFGSVLVVVTYLYFSGLVLLVGAVINAVLGSHSSGDPGGVGRGATSTDTVRNDSLTRGELAVYLRDLREELTGRYERMRPSAERSDDHPRPAGDVEVIERSSADGDARQVSVTLRWNAESTPESDGPVVSDD
jgi:membrane protein